MKIQTKPRKTPTFKQAQFAKHYIKNRGNGVKSAMEVYDANYENAKAISHENLQKDIVKEEISKQLDKAGLSLTDLNMKMATTIDMNMVNGKPSQSVAADLIKFAFKLHNALPANKSQVSKLTLHGNIPSENITDLINSMKENNKITQSLIDDLSST